MMRSVALALACVVSSLWIAGCATDRLDAAPPSGVNLTGEWKFDPNLSDDPDKLGPDPDQPQPQHTPGSHRGHGGGRGGGGGINPMGSPDGITPNFTSNPAPRAGESATSNAGYGSGGYASPGYDASTASASGYDSSRLSSGPDAGGFLPVALTAPGLEQAAPLPPSSGTPSNTKPSRGASINRLLRAPMHMSITQNGGTIVLKAEMADGATTEDEYASGTKTTVPYGPDNTAERTTGWRGPVFVVTLTAKKGGSREDDFAIDEEGHLIMTTQTKGGKLGKVAITRVYDRVRGAQS